MHIGGLQKTTLLDYPGKVACTVFLPGCNLRCPFCHNPDLVLPQKIQNNGISPADLMQFLRKRQNILDGVCITGGEPTLDPELPELIRAIRSLGFAVKLDTNGSNPQMLEKLMQEELVDYVAMDIKNAPARYRETCGGIDILDAARESVRLLRQGNICYEFRTTVSSLHTEDDMREISRWLHGDSLYFLQPFVDSGSLVGSGVHPLTDEQIRALHAAVLPDLPNARIRGI